MSLAFTNIAGKTDSASFRGFGHGNFYAFEHNPWVRQQLGEGCVVSSVNGWLCYFPLFLVPDA